MVAEKGKALLNTIDFYGMRMAGSHDGVPFKTLMNFFDSFRRELIADYDEYTSGYARVIVAYMDSGLKTASRHATIARMLSAITISRSVLAEVLLDPVYEIKCTGAEMEYQTNLRNTMLYKQCKVDIAYRDLKRSELLKGTASYGV